MPTYRVCILLFTISHVLCDQPTTYPKVESVRSAPRPYIAPHTQPVNADAHPGADTSRPPAQAPPPPHVYPGGQGTVHRSGHPVFTGINRPGAVPQGRTVELPGVVRHQGPGVVRHQGPGVVRHQGPAVYPGAVRQAGAGQHPAAVRQAGAGQHPAAVPQQLQGAGVHHTGTAQRKTVKKYPDFSQGNSVSFSSTSGGGPGQRQCSFTVSSPNTYHASSDDFAYPSSMVQQAADNNPLAKQIFSKYLQHRNSGGNFVGTSPALSFGARGVPGLAGLGGNQGPSDGGFDGHFGGIGRTVDNGDLGRFPHATPQFPENGIQHGNNFGINNGFGNSGSFPNPFSNFQFKRKKRQAISGARGLGTQVQSVCPSKKGYIYSFKKYNVDCYPYKPAVQGFQMVKCTQEKCNHCGSSGARCVEELATGWVWSYCHQGPQGNNLSLEYIEYPAFCVCKTIHC